MYKAYLSVLVTIPANQNWYLFYLRTFQFEKLAWSKNGRRKLKSCGTTRKFCNTSTKKVVSVQIPLKALSLDATYSFLSLPPFTKKYLLFKSWKISNLCYKYCIHIILLFNTSSVKLRLKFFQKVFLSET